MSEECDLGPLAVWDFEAVESRSNVLKTKLDSTLSPVNHKGLYQGGGRLIMRYIVESKAAKKAAIRPDEQSGKAESCRENLWNEI